MKPMNTKTQQTRSKGILRFSPALFGLGIFLIFCPAVRASEETLDENSIFDLSLEDLMEVEIVSASNKLEKIWDTPSNITVINEQQIREWGMRDLKDVLRRVAGYNVVADRDEWSFSARGSISDNNQKYLILIDGHKMNSIDNFGPGNIHELPMDLSSVKQIEIIRGPGSVVWGSGALAGVINIITKTAADLGPYKHHISGTWGEDQTYKTNFQIGREYDNSDWILMGSWAKSAGNTVVQSSATANASANPPAGGFPILDTSTGFSDHPFGTYRTDMDRNDGGYMLHFKGRKDKFSLNAFAFQNAIFNRHYESERGRENYLTNEKYFIEGIYADQIDDWDVKWKMSYHYNKARYFNEDGLPIRLEKDWIDKAFNTGLSFGRYLNDQTFFHGGLEYTYTRTGPDDSSVTSAAGVETKSSGLATEDHDFGGYFLFDWEFAEDMMLVAGTGINYNDGRGTEEWVFSPRAGLIWHETEDITHKVLYNHAFLRPAAFQTEVRPVDSEEMDQVEYIYMRKIGKSTVTGTYYWQRLDGFLNINSFAGGYNNSGDYKSQGVEVEFNSPLWDNHDLWANISYGCAKAGGFPSTLSVNGQRVNPGGEVLSDPDLMFNAGATFRFMDNTFFLSPAVRHVGTVEYRATPATTTLADAQYDYVGPFTYVDLNIGYEPTDQLGMYLNFVNLTDIKARNHLSIWNGTITQPGRYVEFKLVYKF